MAFEREGLTSMSDHHQDFERTTKASALRIKTLRIEKSLSQTALAQLSGLTVRSVSRIERGEVHLTLADIFNVAQTLQTQILLLLRGIA